MSRLGLLLNQQEKRIEELENIVDFFRNKYFADHQIIDEKEKTKEYPGYNKLPLPRIEMRINPLREDWYEIEWIYGIVYKHFDDNVLFIPLSKTTSSGSSHERMKQGKIELPFRDGLHVRVDAKVFNMDAFVLCNGRIEEIYDGDYGKETFENAMSKMKRV